MRRVRCGLRMRMVGARHRRAGNKVDSTLALIPAFSPRRRRIVRRFLGMSGGRIGRKRVERSEHEQKLFPLRGERVRVREVVTHFSDLAENSKRLERLSAASRVLVLHEYRRCTAAAPRLRLADLVSNPTPPGQFTREWMSRFYEATGRDQCLQGSGRRNLQSITRLGRRLLFMR